MSTVVAAYAPQTLGCEIDGCRSMTDEGVSNFPVIEIVIDGTTDTVAACALCIAEAWERATGWRFVNQLLSMRAGSVMGAMMRDTNKSARRSRGRKGGDVLAGVDPRALPLPVKPYPGTSAADLAAAEDDPDERAKFPDDGRPLTDGALTDEHTV